MSFNRRVQRVLGITAGMLAGVCIALLAAGAYVHALSRDLPEIDAQSVTRTMPRTSIVYAADGSVIAEWHGEENRTVIAFGEMPRHLRDAVVAVEDRRFYEHDGVDFEAIARALKSNTEAGEVRQGGSTITQQLVKLLFTKGERTLDRKMREALLAWELESRTDKDKVLETYLNTVYFGNGAYGVEAASERYFSTTTSALTLAQSAQLAAMIRSPTRYDPRKRPADARTRRDLVLAQMREQNYITEAQERSARGAALEVSPPTEIASVAPYFVEYVKQELVEKLGAEKVYEGGLRVYTTLDPALQKLAERASRVLPARTDPEVAIVSVRPSDGAVLAMVGGRDFRRNQFNLAAQGKRQPGSAFKPFVLVTALERGIAPGRLFSARPYEVPVKDGIWRVDNYENAKTRSSVTLQAATNWSVNAVYARLMMEVGPPNVVDTARRMGITSELEPHPAIALGGLTQGVSPLEMASAYGTLAASGVHVAPSGIVDVRDDTDVVLLRPSRDATRAVAADVAAKASSMLHDVIEKGTGTAARIGVWSAGKTGTTQSYRDAWFVGWSGDIATAVWVGYPQAQVDMIDVRGIKVTGGSYPAKIWASLMRNAPKRSTVDGKPGDAGQPTMTLVCQDSMQLAGPRCPQPLELPFTSNEAPKRRCTIH